MPTPTNLFRSTVLLTAGQGASYALSFTRNVVLARALSKADFGLAAIFSMTVIMLEVAGRMSFGQQVVQAKAGDSPDFQSTSQTFQLVGSAVSALLIASLAAPLASLMHVPSAAWAFALLAVVPLARGLEHLDNYRLQRDLNYIPAVVSEVLPQALVTAAAWPLAKLLPDYRTIILLIVAKATLGTVLTHLFSKRPYRLSWNKDLAADMWAFGWPLLLNGVLIFISQQADQVLIGSWFSLATLASYSLSLSLVTIPGNIFAQVASSLLLPILSRYQDDSSTFRIKFMLCLEIAAIASVMMITPIIVGGGLVASVIYGPRYSDVSSTVAILGSAAAIRFLRIAPAIAAIAKADTVNQLYSNIVRGLGLPLAAAAVASGSNVASVAFCALIAEVGAAVVSLLRLSRKTSIPTAAFSRVAIYVAGSLATATACSIWLGRSPSVCAITSSAGLVLIGPVLAAALLFPKAYAFIHDKLSSVALGNRRGVKFTCS